MILPFIANFSTEAFCNKNIRQRQRQSSRLLRITNFDLSQQSDVIVIVELFIKINVINLRYSVHTKNSELSLQS